MTNITPTTPPPEGCIDTQVIGHVLLIGINRPAKRNGWTPPCSASWPRPTPGWTTTRSSAWACCMRLATTSPPGSTCPP